MMGAFDDLIPQAKAKGRFDDLIPQQNAVTGTAESVANGLLANFGDEARAAVRATVPGLIKAANTKLFDVPEWFPSWLKAPEQTTPVSEAPDWNTRYTEELGQSRQSAKNFEAESPYLSTGGNITGGVLGTMMALPAAATRAAPTLFGNVVKSGVTGGALGAVAGFGGGEGGFENRAANAVIGGGIGATLGGAIPIAGMAGRAAMETAPGRYVSEKLIAPAARSLSSVFEGPIPAKSLSAAAPDGSPGVMGPMGQFADRASNVAQSGAVNRLATAMQRGKIDPLSAGRRMGNLGDEAMLADVDPQFMSMARMANTMPGGTRTHAATVLNARDKSLPDIMVRGFEGAEPPPSSFALRGEGQAFDQNLRAVGNAAYGDMVEAGLRQTPELIEIQSNPIVSRAIDTVMNIERQTRQGTNRAPASPVEIMHKVKQSIWDLGFDAATARPGPNASFYRDLGTEYMNRLKAANPALAEADRRYAQAASLPEFFDAGRALLSGGSTESATATSAPGLGDLLRGADRQQALAARAGSTNAAREQAFKGPDQAVALAKNVDTNKFTQAKIGELYDPAQAADIARRANTVRTYRNTKNDIMGGSKSIDKAMEIADTGNAQVRLGGGGVSGRIIEKVDDLINRMAGPNEAVRDEIGRIMLNPNTAENQRILRLAQEILRKRQAGNVARPASVEGLASALSEK